MKITWFDLSVISVAITLLLATTEKLQGLANWFTSFFFTKKRCNRTLANIILSYLNSTCTTNKNETYGLIRVMVKPLFSVTNVAFRVLWGGSRRYRYKGRWIWYLFNMEEWKNQMSQQHYPDSTTTFNYTFGFVKGVFNWEGLIRDAVMWANSQENERSRFRVVKLQSSTFSGISNGPPTKGFDPARAEKLFRPTGGNVPLSWSVEDIGDADTGVSLDDMYLPGEVKDLTTEVRNWYRSKIWFMERGIPWCRKYGLEGGPGTGKTSFARAVAKDLGIPIIAMDIATATNVTMLEMWDYACSESPCLILIEDIDAVFDGRENTTGVREGLTFNCLLECLDGVSKNDSGVIVMISSNHMDKLDPALCRPGRMDRRVCFSTIDKEGKLRMAKRILGDSDSVKKIIESTGEITPCEFQEACFREALHNRFNDSLHDN
jgi:hypothetical protein